jgi:hypothetical protein
LNQTDIKEGQTDTKGGNFYKSRKEQKSRDIILQFLPFLSSIQRPFFSFFGLSLSRLMRKSFLYLWQNKHFGQPVKLYDGLRAESKNGYPGLLLWTHTLVLKSILIQNPVGLFLF